MKRKEIVTKFAGPEQGEGVGARIRRFIGGRHVPNLDPWLLLDSFRGRLPAAFPDHPHRGFETIMYTTEGTFLHEDFKGHTGKLTAGDV